jgi:ABC-2 type transport system permease protein
MSLGAMLRCFYGILWRELLRFLHQYTRFVAALVRPLIWLFVFAAGFRSVLGVSIVPPYQTYILYDEYVIPGLVAMILCSMACRDRCPWSTTASSAACACC